MTGSKSCDCGFLIFGAKGPTGPSGLTGSQGPFGPFGPKGPTGARGATGPLDPLIKDFPLIGDAEVGDLVAVVKGPDGASARKLLCSQWEWAAAIEDPNMVENAVDCCGNIYALSLFTDPIMPSFYNAGNNGNTPDMIGRTGIRTVNVSKVDSNGKWEWNATVSVPSFSTISKIVVDGECNVYAVFNAATEQNSLDFYNAGNLGGSPDLVSRSSTSDRRIVVAKIESDGKWLWAATVETNDDEFISGRGISVGSGGNLYLTGISVARPNFFDADNNGIVPDLVGRTDSNIQSFVAKLTTAGDWQWVATVGGPGNETVRDTDTDCQGNSYLSILSGEPLFYNAGNTGGSPDMSGLPGLSLYVAKINTDGVWLWSAGVGMTSSNSQLSELSLDEKGNPYIGVAAAQQLDLYNKGNTGGTSDLVSRTLTNRGNFLLRISTFGEWLWVAAVEPSDQVTSYGVAVAVDNCRRPYLSSFFSNVSFGPGEFRYYNAGNLIGPPDVTSPIGQFIQAGSGRASPNGVWAWTANFSPFSSLMSFQGSTVTDCCRSFYTVQSSSSTMQFYNPVSDGSVVPPTLSSRTPTGFQTTIAKLTDDSASAKTIGVVQSVNGNVATIQFEGLIGYGPGGLSSGCNYFIDCDPLSQASLTTYPCSECCPNRYVGVACDQDSLLWSLGPKLCTKK